MDLQAKYNALVAQAESIRDLAEEDGRDLTADELATIEAKLDKADSVKAEMDLMSRFDDYNKVDKPKSASQKTSVTKCEPAWEKDPKKGFANQTEFFHAVYNASVNPESAPENLRVLAVSGDGHHTYSDPAGGFLVPSGFLPDVLSIGMENDPIGGRTTRIPMASPTVDIPARVDKNHSSSVSGGLQVYRRREEATITSSQMTLENVKLKADKLTGLAYATEELLSDSAISVAALIAAGFNDEFTSKLIDERINGTGVGEFLGVTQADCFVSQAKESGQTADTIVEENIFNMRSRCWGYQNAVWLANHDTYTQLATLADAGNNRLLLTNMAQDLPETLLGRPIFFTEYVSTLGDANDIILCNFTQYLEGLYQPLQSAESIHVRFTTDERAFKFSIRNAGAPWWSAALTPKNSSTTLSPFVGLAARA